jgi:sirohydrochlorin ferrochelatase
VTLVIAAHGTRDPAGVRVAYDIAELIRPRLPGIPVEVAFADVIEPSVASVVGSADGPAVVVPAFLAAGYHVRVDLPRQVGGRAAIAAPLGPAPSLVAAAHQRLVAAGWRPSTPVVLAAAGSSDPRALADARRAAALLGARCGTPVRVGYLATAAPKLGELVDERMAVATWLLAPGSFHRAAAGCGAALVADPIGAHPSVAALIVRRYREARASG